jgi:hypothetical protein
MDEQTQKHIDDIKKFADSLAASNLAPVYGVEFDISNLYYKSDSQLGEILIRIKTENRLPEINWAELIKGK